jgi:hypothetical protein
VYLKEDILMQNRYLRGIAVLCIVLSFILAVNSVFAGSIAFSGTFDGDPTMNVVAISTPNCTSQGSTDVRYDAYLFTVTATGAYNFSAASTGGAGTLASIYIMDSNFNPVAALGNCIAGSNNGLAPATPTTLNNVNLTAETLYYLVIFDDTFAQTTPGYNFGGNGVGDFLLGGPGEEVPVGFCTNPLPSESVVRNVPLGAPAYFDARLDTRVNFDLPAGNWYVTDTSGDFAHVWIACEADLIWIPTSALGG